MRTFRSLVLAAGLVAVAGTLLVLAAGTGSAADPFTAGQPSTRSLPLDATGQARAVARLRALGPGLGLPAAARHAAARLEDRVEHATYDEVTGFDAADRAVSVARFELDGRLRTAVRLGWRLGERVGPDVAPAAVPALAERLARSAGLVPIGRPVVTRQQSTGWLVAWPRTVSGVPVVADGLRVTLWSDGSFHSLARSERPLAASPATVIDEARVRALAAAKLDAWFPAPDRGGLTVEQPSLAWVAPNDTFEPALPDAPAATLRLAWVASVRATGPAAGRVEAVELWFDAGDGRLLGGDVLR